MICADVPFSPDVVGYDDSRIDAINSHLTRLIDEKIIQSGNYCLSRYGKVFANVAVGKQSFDPSDTRPLLPDNIRGIASITKLVCATAIFKLVEDGFLRPNQLVSTVIPEFEKVPFDKITIAHLLSHTSGIRPDGGCFTEKFKGPWAYIAEKVGKTWMESALNVGVYNEPDKEWAYCSFGFVVLGEIIKKITGIKAEEYILKNICEPCGMKDTSFWDYQFKDITAEKALELSQRLYVQDKDMFPLIEGLKNFTEENQKLIIKAMTDEGFEDVPGTAGNILSTTLDLNKFGVMLMNNGITEDGTRVLGRKTIERMTENYTTFDIKDNCWSAGGIYRMYALGPDTRRNADCLYSKGTFFHEGAGACALLIDPVEKMVASLFVPFVSDWNAQALYNTEAVMWSGLK